MERSAYVVLRELHAIRRQMVRRDELIAEARDAGATWPQIVRATGLTRKGASLARERYLSGDPKFPRQSPNLPAS